MYLANFQWSRGYKPPGHDGVDILTPYGTPLPALESGQVQFAGWITYGKYRELIVIVQSSGFFVVYGHLSSAQVLSGQMVNPGQQIAVSGNSGFVLPAPTSQNPWSGAHLHIEERIGTKSASLPLSAYGLRDITPRLNAYGGSDMDTGKVVDDLVRKFVGIDPNKYGARQDKINYLNAGGGAGTLAEDLLRSKSLFYANDTLANEIHVAGYGRPAEQWWIDQKEAAMGAGFPPSQLILEVMPGGDQQGSIDQALTKLDEAESILKAA